MFDIESIPISDVDKKRKITFPKKPSKELAEFIGILTGDGYMNRYGKYFHLVEIAGDSRHDKEYIINYVCPMIKNLFNLIPKIIFRKDQNTMYIRIMSKGLFEYLFYMGFKYGKKGEIGIPNWIIEDEVFFISFIKGLADTDFSLVLLNRNQKKYLFYPRISVGLKSKNLIQILEAKFKQQLNMMLLQKILKELSVEYIEFI